MRVAALIVFVLAPLLLLGTGRVSTERDEPEFVALWITRWDYRTRADVEQAIDRAAGLGVTDVLWQVRGQCDAFYPSSLEPWGEELFRDLPAGTRDPGFDPLKTAIERAHARGMRLHAWMNVMPMWRGTAPPRDLSHPLHARPEWRLRDAKGEPQPLNEHYVIVNPLLPEVHEHIVGVARDLCTRYELDGLHLDYVRYVSDSMKDPAAYCADERSVNLFREATGRAGLETAEDREALRGLIRDRISELVRRIREEALAHRPGAVLTAAVWRRPELARDQYLQDAATWAREGVIDRAIPMIYTEKDAQFEDDLRAWTGAVGGEAKGKVTAGIGTYKHAPADAPRQIEGAEGMGSDGVAVFAYAALFESVDPTQEKTAEKVKERAERMEAVQGAIARVRGTVK